jgi:hypothetical protein
MPNSSVKYVGLDVHKEAIVVAVRDGTGKLVMESIIETKASTLLDFLHELRQRSDKELEPGERSCVDGSPELPSNLRTVQSGEPSNWLESYRWSRALQNSVPA